MTLRRAAALSVGKGVVGELCAQFGHRRARQDRRDRGARIRPASRRTEGASAAWSRCTSPPPIRRPSTRPGSIRRRSSARRTCWPKNSSAGQARQRDRQDRRVRASRPSTKRSACWIRPSSSTTRRAWRRRSRRAKARSARRSRSRASCAIALGEGIDRPEGDFGGEVAALAGAH